MIEFLRWFDAAVPKGSRFFNKHKELDLTAVQIAERRVRRTLLSVVGSIAILFIPVVVFVDALTGPFCYRNSLSAYVFSPLSGAVFISGMAAIGAVLLSYRGECFRDTFLSKVAGLAAIVIGIYSTTGPGFEVEAMVCDARVILEIPVPSQSGFSNSALIFEAFENVEILHYAAVFILFVIMFIFCASFFRLDSAEDRISGGILSNQKVARNVMYLLCALVLAISGLLLLASMIGVIDTHWWNNKNGTLFVEIASFVALGAAWLVKGRFFNTLEGGP